MNKEIYLIKSGSYSDISTHGYFDNLEDAEKYVAYHNSTNKNCNENDEDDWWYEDLWISKTSPINSDVKDVEAKRYHEIVFDITLNNDSGTISHKMRNEPNRYNVYVGNDKETCVEYAVYARYSWIGFLITANDRSFAEKIACDMLSVVKEKYAECRDIKLATSMFKNKHRQ